MKRFGKACWLGCAGWIHGVEWIGLDWVDESRFGCCAWMVGWNRNYDGNGNDGSGNVVECTERGQRI